MQVNPNHNIGPVYPQRAAAASTPGNVQSGDQAQFGGSDALNEALSQIPDSRPEVVENAKSLIADVNYPPPETIRKLSQLLAIGISAAQE